MVNPVMTEWLNRPTGLATRLTTIKIAAGHNNQSLSDAIGLGRSKVSRIANGRQKPTADEIRAWVTACDAADQGDELVAQLQEVATQALAWRAHTVRGGNVQAFYNRLADTTTHTVLVETALIPGPLQTADYARAALSYLLPLNYDEPDVDAVVADRLVRQALLRDAHKRWEFLMTEHVLHASPATPTVMAAQLDWLLQLFDLPTVTIGIIPATAGLPAIPLHSYGLYDDEHVLTETFTAEQMPASPAELTVYRRVTEDLRRVAETHDDARALIQSAASSLANT